VWGGVSPPKSAGRVWGYNQYASQRLNLKNTLWKKLGGRAYPSPPRDDAPGDQDRQKDANER